MFRVQKTFLNNQSTFYLLGTPIGNLKDVSQRVIEILEKVDLIYCEDTRVSLKLLKNLNIDKKLKSLNKFNEFSMIEEIFKDINEYSNIALISDAGVPCISDPGAIIVNGILNNKINVNICPVNCGPAYIHAIVTSGFICKNNLFLGFLNKKNIKNELVEIFERNQNNDVVISFYESVHRIESTLNLLNSILQENTKILLAREVTKINEEFIWGTIKDICNYVDQNNLVVKGEFCIVIDSKFAIKDTTEVNFFDIEKEFEMCVQNNISKKQAIKLIAKKYKINKNQLIEKFYKKF